MMSDWILLSTNELNRKFKNCPLIKALITHFVQKTKIRYSIDRWFYKISLLDILDQRI